MPLDHAALKSWHFPDVEHRYTARDTGRHEPAARRSESRGDGETVSFRARAIERDAVILNNGLAKIAAA